MQRLNSFGGTLSFWTVRAVLLAGALLCSRCVQAGGVVTNCDWPSLQTALNGGGIVTFQCDGTITFPNTILITKDVLTKDTTLDASGHHIVLDGNQALRHFVVTNDATLRLVNLTLANGYDAGIGFDDHYGGSIYNPAGNLELIQCQFVNNRLDGTNGSAFGGAIYNDGGKLYATNCLFVGNQAIGAKDSSGGAIFSTNGVVELESTTFTNNVAFGKGGIASGGAACVVAGMTTITNCIFLNNSVQGGMCCLEPFFERPAVGQPGKGGAVYHDGGSITVTGSQFFGNNAAAGSGFGAFLNPGFGGDGNGGALCNNKGELTVQSSLFANNQSSGGRADVGSVSFAYSGAGLGGAIFNKETLTLVNSTLLRNIASGGPPSLGGLASDWHNGGAALGGGIFSSGGPATLLNVTLANNIVTNSDTTEPALGDNLASTNKPIALTNTILFHSQSKTNVFGPITDGGHNLFSDSSANFTSSTSRSNTDPLLAPLTDNGGPTSTMALLRGSPAIDAGDDSLCPAADQRGVPRPIGAHCDIGAYESVPAPALIRGPSGNVRVQFTWQPQQNLTAQATTDFAVWTTISTATTSTNGFVEFKDTNASQFSLRFYRAVSQ